MKYVERKAELFAKDSINQSHAVPKFVVEIERSGQPFSNNHAMYAFGAYCGYVEGYSQGQKDLMEECADGFEEWLESNFKQPENEKQAETLTQLKDAWQACALNKQKEIDDVEKRYEATIDRLYIQLKERDEKIKSLMIDLEWAALRIIDCREKSLSPGLGSGIRSEEILQKHFSHFDGKGE